MIQNHNENLWKRIMQIENFEISNFKKIKNASIDMEHINILVGANNSGKTCILQGLHFGISILQTTSLIYNKQRYYPKTLALNQMLYSPTDEFLKLQNNGKITERIGPDFYYRSVDDNECKLSIRRGKNANLSIAYHRNNFYRELSNPIQPFSIYVPGLAGVPLREEYRSDGVIAHGIARGDANLFLRNILLRISNDIEKHLEFNALLQNLFPHISIIAQFDENHDIYIQCYARVQGVDYPIDMLGIGVLQATQLLAYVVNYQPSIILLDEPDSHLHPSNQRLLASVLYTISRDTNTKIMLATHSRHLLDAFQNYPDIQLLWLKDGELQEYSSYDEIPMLLDIGALDYGDRILHSNYKVLFLTEDENTSLLESIIEISGFSEDEYMTLSYQGLSRSDLAFSIAHFVNKIKPGVYIVILRDSDMLQSTEIDKILEKYNRFLPENSKVIFTRYTDVEHYYCQKDHLIYTLNISEHVANDIINEAIIENNSKFIMDFSAKRGEASREVKNADGRPCRKEQILNAQHISWDLCKGKTLFKKIKDKAQNKYSLNPSLLYYKTDTLFDENINSVAIYLQHY